MASDTPSRLQVTIAEMERRNTRIFFAAYLLTFFAAPVAYVGVVQAALCDKLGASATVANLPGSAYFLGNIVPIFLAWLIPHRLERAVLVGAHIVTAALLGIVCLTLVLPLENSFRIGVLIGQGLIQGFSSSTANVYRYQCLGRGTTPEARAKALKLTFTFSPIAAVLGSLGAQVVLNHGISVLTYPYDFALIYFIGVPCFGGAAVLNAYYKLPPLKDEPRQALLSYLAASTRSYFRQRTCVMLFVAYALWYATLAAMPNLSLYTREVMGTDPKEVSGLIMAIRFGFKALGGFVLGVLTLRYGIRMPLTATVLLVGAAILWAWTVPGHFYLVAFGLMGAGELGGAYFPNYMVAISSATEGARNLSLLTIATLVASSAGALHGILTDLFGFQASFRFGVATAAIAFLLVLRLPSRPAQIENSGASTGS